MRHVLALDQGTTGATALVVAEDGRVVGRGYRELAQHFPRPGWVEHDPFDLLRGTLEAARDALDAARVEPVAVGITNQRETVLLWDRATGVPLGRAIVWQDRRTTARCRELGGEAATIAQRTGLVVDPYFSATKLEWMLSDPSVARRARRGELAAGTVDSWLVWQLTGGRVHATEPTNASRTMLFDIDAMTWSDELCALFGVPAEVLPEVRRSSGSFGTAEAGCFGVALPITGVAGDQQAALFGQGCVAPGEGKNTYGTGAFLLLNTGGRRAPASAGLLATIACDASGGPAYALEGAIFVAGAALQWLRDGLGIIATAAESEQLARSVPDSGGVCFVPAMTGLGAPHWEAAARGTIVGITRGTTRAHLARAALEAIAYATADVVGAMRAAYGACFDRLRVDGGAAENDWLMQFQADTLGVPLERPAMLESTALGAAGLAGLAAGVWGSAEAFAATRALQRFEPGDGRTAAQRGAREWARAVRAAITWARDA